MTHGASSALSQAASINGASGLYELERRWKMKYITSIAIIIRTAKPPPAAIAIQIHLRSLVVFAGSVPSKELEDANVEESKNVLRDTEKVTDCATLV
jgi:hypothetical protein